MSLPNLTVGPAAAKTDQNFRYLDDNKQDKKMRILTSVPNASTMGDGEFVIVKSGADKYLYVRVDGTLWKTQLTAA
jgi:hypothetical protein